MAQAWAIARCDNPRSCLSRRISRIFLIDSLAARHRLALPSEGRSVPRSGLPTSVHDHRMGCQLPRIRCSTSRIRCSTSADPVFNFGWIRRSRSPGLRTRTKGKDESGVRYVKRNAIAGHRDPRPAAAPQPHGLRPGGPGAAGEAQTAPMVDVTAEMLWRGPAGRPQRPANAVGSSRSTGEQK